MGGAEPGLVACSSEVSGLRGGHRGAARAHPSPGHAQVCRFLVAPGSQVVAVQVGRYFRCKIIFSCVHSVQFPDPRVCLSLGLSPVFPVPPFLCSTFLIPLLSADCTVPMGQMRAKSWLLWCSEVASPVSWGLCFGQRARGCILGLWQHVTSPDKEYFMGMALPFEVASLARLCGCYQTALSRELLTQLASSSLFSPAPIPGLGHRC